VRVLLLGTGMQGKAALHDLARSPAVREVVAADRDIGRLEALVRERGYGARVRCHALDATDEAALGQLVGGGFDVVIDLLPSPFVAAVATQAVRHGVHLVNTFYVSPDLLALGPQAEARGIAILPEFGMDPGIDLVLLGDAVRGLEEVTEVISYGAGIPEPQSAANPIHYKVSWSLAGVLRAYRRGARIVRDGFVVDIPPAAQFHPDNVHDVEVAGFGTLEAYPNGDAVHFAEVLGLDASRLRNTGRYSLRYPGHCRFWNAVAALGLLDEEPVVLDDGTAVDRIANLTAALEPRLQYGPGERDVAVIRNQVTGTREGTRVRVVQQLIDRRDLE
jgi:lysine 6-dehydrogenase